jgi:ribose 5-phosphate isomerase B
VGPELAKTIVDHWLEADFAGGLSAPKVAKIEQVDARHRALAYAERETGSHARTSEIPS